MNEENKKIKLPVSAVEVELKSWITGRDDEYINAPLFEKFSVKPTANKEVDLGEIDGSSIMEMKHRGIEKVVVSIGGVLENVLEKALDLHKDDYNALLEAVDGVLKKN